MAFSAQEARWIHDADEARRRLSNDALDIMGYIAEASNGAVLCAVGDHDDGVFAVYKPEAMERPLWDFPDGTLHQREVAAHVISDFLGWDVVPPTVHRDGPSGPGSVQLFVPHDPAEHYFTYIDEPRWEEPLAKLAMFDMLINNADRKGGHILHNLADDRLYGIDNGLAFNAEPKLRTVVWDVDHVPFAEPWQEDLRRLAAALAQAEGPLFGRLVELMSRVEALVLRRRAIQVAEMEAVPTIHPDRRHYPWPPV